MRRREFITLIGGAAAWPLTTYAQQPDGQPRIGVLMTVDNGPDGQARLTAFRQGLQQLGWIEGRNIRIDIRWSGGDDATTRKNAVEMVALAPNIILATGSSSMGPLMQISGVVPVVFVIVPDPVGAGYVNSLARPGGNATGFSTFEYSIGGKWLDLLKQIAPGITRVAVLRDPTISGGLGQFGAIQSAASSFAVEVTAINLRDATEIERAIMAFATTSSGGLIVTASPLAVVHRDFIVTLAARHKLPAIYFMDRKADIGLAPITVFIGCNRSRRQLRKGRVVFRRRYSYASGEEASPKDMCQSVAKLSWIFRPISVQDPCLVEQQMRHVLLE
jgi:putative ABC transport system substrate-binding protein